MWRQSRLGALALLEHAYTHHAPPRVRNNTGAVADPRGWAAGLAAAAAADPSKLRDALRVRRGAVLRAGGPYFVPRLASGALSSL